MTTSIAPPFPKMDGSQPCRYDPEAFTPDSTKNAESRETAKICRRSCPFVDACLDYALAHPVSGIWGGMTDSQRTEERRKRGIRLLSYVRASADSSSCTRGHLRTEQNAYKDIKGYWCCRPCRRDDEARRNAERRASGVPVRPRRPKRAPLAEVIPMPRRSVDGVRA